MLLAVFLEYEHYAAGQELIDVAQWGDNLDATDLLVALQNIRPIDLANRMVRANPTLPLDGRLSRVPAPEALKAVLRMFVDCDPFRAGA